MDGMRYFTGYLFLFILGSMIGWVIEVFYRRLFSAKKWINPGFLNGPYLPLYGFGVVIMYAVSDLPIAWWWKLLLFLVLMTAIEYVAGIIFIKGMNIKLARRFCSLSTRRSRSCSNGWETTRTCVCR